MAIIQLDEETINKIAAGEVVERPSSVVKELIENSLDASATKINVMIVNGGIDKIVVEDNGCGMSKEDTEKSILRHATSKIKSHIDLFSISTMGFRGEALSSVAAVSRLTISTRQKSDEQGFKLKVENKEVKREVVAQNPGTKVVVENIFYNVPARKKFLKSKSTEQKTISDIVTRYALIHSNIAFTLRNEDGVLIEKPITNSIKENIAAIYGMDVAKESFVVDNELVKGVIVKPTINRSTRDYMSIYVNKRYVKSKLIEDAVMDSLKTLIFHDRYPIAVLNLKIDTDKIDVNVHPSKKIVKFDNEELIYQEVFDAVKEAIQNSDLFAETQLGKDNKKNDFESQALLKEPIHDDKYERVTPQYNKKTEEGKYFESAKEQQSHLVKEESETYQTKANVGEVNIVGQIHKTYIIIETKEGYAIIDQHAAEERINYEKFKKQFEEKEIVRQELLNGVSLELTTTEKATIDENLQMLNDFGFKIENFGEKDIIVREIPASISLEHDLKQTLLTVVEKFNEKRNIDIDDKQEAAIKYMSCRGSIKAGEILTMQQMKDLIGKLMQTHNKYTCPHGRPTMIRFPLSKIEKDFKRTE